MDHHRLPGRRDCHYSAHRMVGLRLLSHQQFDRATALYSAAAAPLRERTLGLVDRLVHHEALLLAYGDAFLIAGISMLLCAGGGLFLRGKRR